MNTLIKRYLAAHLIGHIYAEPDRLGVLVDDPGVIEPGVGAAEGH